MNNPDFILEYLKNKPNSSSKEIFEGVGGVISYATVKRQLANLLKDNYILQQGNAKNTRYSLSVIYNLFYPVDLNEYYSREIDDRTILSGYNFDLIPEILSKTSLFTEAEIENLNVLNQKFTKNIAHLSAAEYEQDMERLSIDLSWKSSQIEGNTYSLLETERLLREKKTADGKTKTDFNIKSNEIVPTAFCAPHYVSLTTRNLKHWESHGYSFSSSDEGPDRGRILSEDDTRLSSW